ncbi:MAG: calcium-binding protein [Pseudomonadota bacterium]
MATLNPADGIFRSIDPRDTYLANDHINDIDSDPTIIELSDIGASAGDILLIDVVGRWLAFDEDDRPNSSLAASFGAGDNPVAPGAGVPVIDADTQIPDRFLPDDSGNTVAMTEDFWVVSGGVFAEVPVGAEFIAFTVDDSFFSDNSALDGNFGAAFTVVDSVEDTVLQSEVTIDGETPFSLFGNDFEGREDRFRFGPEDPVAVARELTVNMSGDFRVDNMQFDLEDDSDGSFKAIINSGDANPDRSRIDFLEFYNVEADFDLTNTRVYSVRGDGDSSRIQLGEYSTDSISIFRGDAEISLGAETFVGAIRLDNGDDTVTGSSTEDGGIRFVDLGGGTNTFDSGQGFVGAVRSSGASDNLSDDQVIIRNGADTVTLGRGVDTTEILGGFVGALVSYGADNTTTIGPNGDVGTIRYSGGVDRLTIDGSNVNTADLGSNSDIVNLINGGTAGTIILGRGQDTLNSGSGNVDAVVGYSGGQRVNVQDDGRVGSVDLSEGANELILRKNARVDSYRTDGGADSLTVNEGSFVDQATMGSGNNTVLLRGDAIVSSLQTGQGNDDIRLNGDARIFSMKIGQGENTVTSNRGNIEQIYSFEGSNTLNIGSGGVQQVVFSGFNTGLTHSVSVANGGFLGSLQTFDDADTDVTVGDGGFNSIALSGGDDTVVSNGGSFGSARLSRGADEATINGGSGALVGLGDGQDTITVNDGGFVDYIRTGKGNDLVDMNGTSSAIAINTGDGTDTVSLGENGAELVNLGRGNDTVNLDWIVAGVKLQINGGGGTDRVDMSDFNTGMTLDLNDIGFQSIGAAPGGRNNTFLLALDGVEEIVTSKRADRVQGSDSADEFIGGNSGADTINAGNGDDTIWGGDGRDVIRGWGGDDVIRGGGKNDTLFGNGGDDVFEFRRGHGTDTIRDFEVGSDRLDFQGSNNLNDFDITQDGNNVRVAWIDQNVVAIIQNATEAEIDNAANFIF